MDKLEAHLLHFDLSRGGFQEATVLVFRTEAGGVQIDPSLVSIRDFHRSMKQFYTDRFPLEKVTDPLSRVMRRVRCLKGF